jgi:hypothetical protein
MSDKPISPLRQRMIDDMTLVLSLARVFLCHVFSRSVSRLSRSVQRQVCLSERTARSSSHCSHLMKNEGSYRPSWLDDGLGPSS